MLTDVPAAETPVLLPLPVVLTRLLPLKLPVAVTVPLFCVVIVETASESLVGTPSSTPSLRISTLTEAPVEVTPMKFDLPLPVIAVGPNEAEAATEASLIDVTATPLTLVIESASAGEARSAAPAASAMQFLFKIRPLSETFSASGAAPPTTNNGFGLSRPQSENTSTVNCANWIHRCSPYRVRGRFRSRVNHVLR
jgi:hypothetical protein